MPLTTLSLIIWKIQYIWFNGFGGHSLINCCKVTDRCGRVGGATGLVVTTGGKAYVCTIYYTVNKMGLTGEVGVVTGCGVWEFDNETLSQRTFKEATDKDTRDHTLIINNCK